MVSIVFLFFLGKDLIRFILETVIGGKLVKKYSLPYSIGCENLKRIGDTIELDPNPTF